MKNTKKIDSENSVSKNKKVKDMKNDNLNDIENEFLTDVKTTIKTKPNSRKKSINSKNKGNTAEREVAKIFSERFKDLGSFHRNITSGAYVGGNNRDRGDTLSEEQKLMMTSDVYCSNKNFKFTIEHKFYKEASFWDLFNDSSDIHQWFSQALGDAESVKKMPMLIVKYNNHKRIVYLLNDYNSTNINPIFAHRDNKTKQIWYCYNLDDILKLEDEFFFTKKIN